MYVMYVYINENLNIYFDKFFNDFLNNNGDIYIFWFSDVVYEFFFGFMCIFNIFIFVFRFLEFGFGVIEFCICI